MTASEEGHRLLPVTDCSGDYRYVVHRLQSPYNVCLCMSQRTHKTDQSGYWGTEDSLSHVMGRKLLCLHLCSIVV